MFHSSSIFGLTALLMMTLGVSVGNSQLQRVANTTLAMPSTPAIFGYSVTNAFGSLLFFDPVCIASPPEETNRLFVVERRGTIAIITNLASPTRSVFLNISSKITDEVEGGLLALVFHPGFATNGYFYVWYYGADTTSAGSGAHNILARYQVSPPAANSASAATEVKLLRQFDSAVNHNGGDLHFGPDGYLYVSLGDEGGGNGQYDNDQRINKDYFSGIIRIDVDKRPGSLLPNAHPAVTTNYAVPPDNPFVGATSFNGLTVNPSSVRTEFWAVGLRNPWRFSFDAPTGLLYAGDVGQDTQEEVDIITKGGNYGWAYREGSIAGPKSAPGGFTSAPPILTYTRGFATNQGMCVIGGFVYRGNSLSQLTGDYVFGDNVSGNIWSLRYDGTNVTSWQQLASAVGLSTFGTDPRNGDVLLATRDVEGGGNTTQPLKRLVYSTNVVGQLLPPTLAETGAFANLTTLAPNAGIELYDINHPFWSDNAVKSRWFSVPKANLTIGFNPTNNWSFPTGTVWIKHFDLQLTNGAPARRIETRLLVKNSTGVYGVTYRWGSSLTNANLVAEGGMDEMFVIDDGGGLVRTQTWHYPGRQECLACHTELGGHALGFNTGQLNRDINYAGFVTNQIQALSDAGYFNTSITGTQMLPALASLSNTTSSTEIRVRSYLAANCVQCHQPGGFALGQWDARFSTPESQAGIINGPLINNLGNTNNRVIKPGSLANSGLLTRIASMGPGHMPPLATSLVNTQAVLLISGWITNDLPVAPIISLSSTAFNFAVIQGNNPADQSLMIANSGLGTLSWTAIVEPGAPAWLTVTPVSGTGAEAITVSVASAALAAGNYSKTITLTAPGAINDRQIASVSLRVTRPPMASNDSYTVSANNAFNTPAPGVLANDTDLDGDGLIAILVSGVSHGALNLSTNGSFTYTPTAGYTGPDSFTYKANDGVADSGVVTVNFTVIPGNQAPVANSDSYTIAIGTLTVGAPGVLGNDTDAEGNMLRAVLVSGVAQGTLSLSTNGSFTYTPSAGFSGLDSFTYRANDGFSDSGVATVNLIVLGNGTNHYDFTNADRASLLAGGWDFLARTPTSATRNTEQTTGAVVDYNQTMHPGVLRIPVDTGDLWAALNDSRNSLFRNLPTNWTSIRLKMSFAPTQNYQQAGLVAYQDDNTYVSLLRIYNSGQKLSFVRETGGSGSVLQSITLTTTANLHLRLDRNATTGAISGFYSVNGTNWTAIGSGVVQSLNNPRLAIFAGGSPSGFPNADLAWAEVVAPQNNPTLSVTPTTLAFSAVTGTNPSSQTLGITNLGGGVLNWSAVADASAPVWLMVSPANGVGNGAVSVAINSAGLPPGNYTKTITVTAAGATGSPRIVTVNLTINAPPNLNVNPTELQFTVTQGANPGNQAVVITNAGGGVLNWTAAAETGAPSWLTVTPTNGTGAATATVSVASASLPAGTYSKMLTFTAIGATNSPRTVTVNLTINPPPPTLSVSPATLNFSVFQGASPASQTFGITNLGGGTLNWTAVAETGVPDWLAVNPIAGANNGIVGVSVASTGLSPGTYSKVITVTAAGAVDSPRTVTVSLIVNPPPNLAVNPAALNFTVVQGGNPTVQVFAITNSGGGTLSWTALADAGAPTWLSINPANGTGNTTVTATVASAGLSIGGYSKTITVTASGATNSPQTVSVNLAVVPPPPILTVSPTTLTFSVVQGNNPLDQVLGITNTGGGAMNWTAVADAGSPAWLTVNPSGGVDNGSVNIAVASASLAPGNYTKTITVTAPGATNSPLTITVNLTVDAPSTLTVNPTTFNFIVVQGSTPANQSLVISNAGSGTLNWTALAGAGIPEWLNISATNGTGNATAVVSVASAGLATGSYSNVIMVTADGAMNSPRMVPAILTVSPPLPNLTVNPTALNFVSLQGANPANQLLAITNSGSGTLNWTALADVDSPAWLSVSPTNGTGNLTAIVSVASASLAVGSYAKIITVSATGATNSPRAIAVTLTVTGSGTNHYDFTYADRASLLAAGWDFLARTPTGATRNTEQTTGAVVDYNQTTHPGVLRIPVDTGDLWAALNDSRNSLFRNLPTNWTSIRLKLSFAPTQNYQQAGLVAYQDDNTYVSLTRIYNSGQKLSFVRETSGAGSVLQTRTLTTTTNLHLRLDRNTTSGAINGYYSVNGTSWTSLGSGVVQPLNNPRLAIFAGASPSGFPNADLAWAEIISPLLLPPPPVPAGSLTITTIEETNGTSVGISVAGITNDRFGFGFQSEPGVNYVVEYKDSWSDPEWKILTNFEGTGLFLPVEDPAVLRASRFYRVRVP